MKKKIALITGITGQDGSYLAELLLKKKYNVHGIIRRSSSFNTSRIDHLYQDPHSRSKNFFLHYGDMTDSLSLQKIINNIKPDEIYNLATPYGDFGAIIDFSLKALYFPFSPKSSDVLA